MRKSNNDSGLTAKRSNRLPAAGLTAILMAVLCGCSSTQQLPLDDAYYWRDKTVVSSSPAPDKRPEVNASSTTPVHTTSVQKPKANSQQPSIEYLNVQDTTVTIRINR